MRMQTLALAGAVLAASGAHAGIQFKANGGAAQSIGAFDFSDGASAAFAAGGDRFSHAVLGAIHDELVGLGATTNGKLTFVAGETTEGLAMFALFDQETGGQANRNVARSTFSYSGAGTGFQNEGGELGGDDAGTFAWWANGRGDAFAATGISNDFSDSFTIGDFTGELSGASGVQVLSRNADGTLEVIELANFFGNGGNFAFAVPVPAAGALAGVGLLGVAVRRRR